MARPLPGCGCRAHYGQACFVWRVQVELNGTVHISDCVNMQGMEPERLISVFWDSTEDKPYPARIRLLCHNEVEITGMLGTVVRKYVCRPSVPDH